MVRNSVIAWVAAGVLAVSWQATGPSGRGEADEGSAGATLGGTTHGIAAVAPVASTIAAEGVAPVSGSTAVEATSAAHTGRIVFARIGVARTGHHHTYLFSAAPDGSDLRRLTWRYNSDSPRWSPDGRRIAYNHRGGVWIMRGDGSRKHRVLARAWMLAWSPSGQALLVGRLMPPSYRSTIGILRLADHAVRWYKPPKFAVAGGADWSWRTNRIVLSRSADPDANADLFSMNPDFTHLKQLTRTPHKHEIVPRWAPAGPRRLAYWVQDYTVPETKCRDRVVVLRLFDDSTRVIRRCTESPAWSPNGSRLLMSKQIKITFNSDLIKVSLATGDGTTVVGHTPRWHGVDSSDWRPPR